MNCVDIETLANKRKSEMNSRINKLLSNCHLARENVNKLMTQAQLFTDRLNCEPKKMKVQFLDTMRELDEYIDVLFEFNLALQCLFSANADSKTTLNLSTIPLPLTSCSLLDTPNLLNMVSSPQASNALPSTSVVRQKRCNKTLNTKKLIDISSSSSECELDSKDENKVELNEDVRVNQNMGSSAFDDHNEEHDINNLSILRNCTLPPQEILQADTVYDAYILHAEELSIWTVPEQLYEVLSEMSKRMEECYNKKTDVISTEMLDDIPYCAFFDESSLTWCRSYILEPKVEGKKNTAQLYLVDKGKMILAPNNKLLPLYPEFCTLPPFAHTCHLAGIDILDQSLEVLSEVTGYVSKFIKQKCKLEIEDNTSESMGSYVRLENNMTINHLLVERHLAIHIDGECTCNSVQENISCNIQAGSNNASISAPISQNLDCNSRNIKVRVTVAGYNKCYNGPAKETHFKHERCNRKSNYNFPDQPEAVWRVPALPLPLPLPAPGARINVRVADVLRCNIICVHLIESSAPSRPRDLGLKQAPQSLDELVNHMNHPAVLRTYRSLETAPTEGELVAAVYTPDKKWYRARVLTHNPSEKTVQVQYVDYGGLHWVNESLVCKLDPLYRSLPFQSVQCVLPEVKPCSLVLDPGIWAKAKNALSEIVLDKVHRAIVISHLSNTLEISLFDSEGVNVAQRLAATGLVQYEAREANASDDTRIPSRK